MRVRACIGLKRPSLYRILSKQGNPTLATRQEILKPLGLRVSVASDTPARQAPGCVPDYAARRRRILGDKILPNMVLLVRDQERG